MKRRQTLTLAPARARRAVAEMDQDEPLFNQTLKRMLETPAKPLWKRRLDKARTKD